MTVDLIALDNVAGIKNATDPTIQIFTDAGSFWHILLGATVEPLADDFPLTLAMMFSGYEVSKLAGGESASRIAGTYIEFGLGMLLSALIRGK